MEKVDRTHWERAELFEFFSAVSHPFYSVIFRVDVTNLYRYVKERHLSFYYAMGYLVTDAVNSVKNFRYAIRDGEVWLLDERIPSLTDLKPGSEQFHIVTLPKVGGIAEFCASAQARSAAQKTLLDQDEENDNLIYISCTPWFDLTGCTNERDFDRDDNIPRITWGRYGEENGRKKLGMSVEQSSHKTVFAKVPAMGRIWHDFGHAFSFASSSSRGIYPSPSYLIWMCCTRFPLDLSGAST